MSFQHVGYFAYTLEGHGIYLDEESNSFQSSEYGEPDFLNEGLLETMSSFIRSEVGDFVLVKVYVELNPSISLKSPQQIQQL